MSTTFGRHPPDSQLARVLELTYFHPDPSVPAILRELSISRATHYRRIEEATRRLGVRLG